MPAITECLSAHPPPCACGCYGLLAFGLRVSRPLPCWPFCCVGPCEPLLFASPRRGQAEAGGAHCQGQQRRGYSTLPGTASLPAPGQEQAAPNGLALSSRHRLLAVRQVRPSVWIDRPRGGGPPKGLSSICLWGDGPPKGCSPLLSAACPTPGRPHSTIAKIAAGGSNDVIACFLARGSNIAPGAG